MCSFCFLFLLFVFSVPFVCSLCVVLLCLCSSFPSLFVCSFVSWVVFFCRAAGFSDRGVKHNLLLGVGGGSWGVLQEVLIFDSFGTLL